MEITEEQLEILRPRFRAKHRVENDSNCWIWFASVAGRGYGQIKIPGTRKQIYAHRLSYMLHKGIIPKESLILHKCDTPLCVNPDHLSVGSHGDNAQDMKSKDRHLRGERNAKALLTEKDVIAMRSLLDQGVLSQKRIAEIFSISQMEVSRIKRGLRWSHVK